MSDLATPGPSEAGGGIENEAYNFRKRAIDDSDSDSDDEASSIELPIDQMRNISLADLESPSKKRKVACPSIDLLTNFFKLKKTAGGWHLQQYRVLFDPPAGDALTRDALIHQHAEQLGGYMYDKNSLLHASHDIPGQNYGGRLDLQSVDEKTGVEYQICLEFVGTLEAADGMYTTFYNALLHKCLFGMGLEEFGRSFFDTREEIPMNQHRLKLWPGFTASIRQHDMSVLLCVDTAYKIIRMANVMETMTDILARTSRSPADEGKKKPTCEDEIVGSTVLTPYNNNKMYHVTDISWNLTPASSFELSNGETITYVQYYKQKYNLDVTNIQQPLLSATPLTKKRVNNSHRGFHFGSEETSFSGMKTIFLIPEFCHITGLTDSMRGKFRLMKDLNPYSQEKPDTKVAKLTNFMKRLRSSTENLRFLQSWGLDFSEDLISVPCRIMGPESIVLGKGKTELASAEKADWAQSLREQEMFISAKLETWAVFVSERDFPNVDNLVQTLIRVAKPLGFLISEPRVVTIGDTNTDGDSYNHVIKEVNSMLPGLKLVCVVLPEDNLGAYEAIKKMLSVEIGLPSQCLSSKNLRSKSLPAICANVVIKMNAKLGGVPWSINIPLKKMMTVGYDACRGSPLTGGKSVGALVACLTPTHYSAFFSTVSFFSSKEEMSKTLVSDLIKGLDAYANVNEGELPDWILFYRDGVDEGQLDGIIQSELPQVRFALETKYNSSGLLSPSFTFVGMSRNSNSTKFFRMTQGQAENPLPGTVCDSVVTLPGRVEFFLIAQAATARQGTMSPAAFNILYDTSHLDSDKLQRLTFKLCHLYFNVPGTVAVPAVCQYAQRLANQTAKTIGDRSSPKLSHYLHYL